MPLNRAVLPTHIPQQAGSSSTATHPVIGLCLCSLHLHHVAHHEKAEGEPTPAAVEGVLHSETEGCPRLQQICSLGSEQRWPGRAGHPASPDCPACLCSLQAHDQWLLEGGDCSASLHIAGTRWTPPTRGDCCPACLCKTQVNLLLDGCDEQAHGCPDCVELQGRHRIVLQQEAYLLHAYV